MGKKPAESVIEIPVGNNGLYEITITSKDHQTLFSDCISSKNRKIILKGFSQKLHNISLTPIDSKPFGIFKL